MAGRVQVSVHAQGRQALQDASESAPGAPGLQGAPAGRRIPRGLRQCSVPLAACPGGRVPHAL
eukprot:15435875-Alexandrium_andersonii.AAC.1